MKTRELLFSVRQRDCVFKATTAGGPGGQHRNKVATAVRCTHPASGAVGYASDDKSQHRNKKVAFRRMAETKVFREWVRMEAARCTGELARIEDRVNAGMREQNIRTEIKENGRWVATAEVRDED
jgi:protein subunit release factor B